MTARRALQLALGPLTLIYAAVSRFDGRRKQRRAYRASLPVVSVGNISVGGSGKTPVVAMLAEWLQHEHDVVILSRGYGRSDRSPRVWRSGEPPPEPATLGDEPALLARGISRGAVGVAPDRVTLLKSLESEWTDAIVILDDGFQHRQLARDVDIVVLDDDSARPPYRLIPAGRLRERPEALRRADIVLATSEAARALALHYLPAAMIFTLEVRATHIERWISHGHQAARSRFDAEADETDASRAVADGPSPPPASGQRVLLVTGIARSERVVQSVRGLGCEIIQHFNLKDHHRYSDDDARSLSEALLREPEAILVTTSKDAVKLERFSLLRDRLHVVATRVLVSDEEQFLRTVAERLNG